MRRKLTEARRPFKTGWYVDQGGRRWHCVVRVQDVVCNSNGGFTVAYHKTFERWGWKFEPSGLRALSGEA